MTGLEFRVVNMTAAGALAAIAVIIGESDHVVSTLAAAGAMVTLAALMASAWRNEP